MNKPLRLILGVRELSKPKGQGYLYYKIASSNDEEFSDIVEKAISKLKSQLEKRGIGEVYLQDIEFENIQAWGQPLVKGTVEQQEA